MERQFRCLEWEEPNIWNSRSHNRNRCIPQGLGGLLRGGSYGRSVVPRGIPVTHQLSRALCRSVCNNDLCRIQSSNESSPTDGECFRNSLHQQNGTNKITNPSPSSHRSMGMVLTTQNSNRGAVSSRGLEHTGRQRVQSHVRCSRIAELNQLWGPLKVDGSHHFCEPSVLPFTAGDQTHRPKLWMLSPKTGTR